MFKITKQIAPPGLKIEGRPEVLKIEGDPEAKALFYMWWKESYQRSGSDCKKQIQSDEHRYLQAIAGDGPMYFDTSANSENAFRFAAREFNDKSGYIRQGDLHECLFVRSEKTSLDPSVGSQSSDDARSAECQSSVQPKNTCEGNKASEEEINDLINSFQEIVWLVCLR